MRWLQARLILLEQMDDDIDLLDVGDIASESVCGYFRVDIGTIGVAGNELVAGSL